MPSSKIKVSSSLTEATSQSPQTPSGRSKPNYKIVNITQTPNSLTVSQNPGEKISRCSSPSSPSANSIYQKKTYTSNPVASTSKDFDQSNEPLDCPNNLSHCKSSSNPLGHAKGYLCGCSSPSDDPKPGPSTTAAEFDLEVFDSCSSCSLEDCWGPDCHHSSCDSSPIAGSENTSVLARSGGRNKSFHRKGNKRQLNISSSNPDGSAALRLSKTGTSTGLFPVSHSQLPTSVLRHNFINNSKTTLGEFSDSSSEDDFIMSSPGKALSTHGK